MREEKDDASLCVDICSLEELSHLDEAPEEA